MTGHATERVAVPRPSGHREGRAVELSLMDRVGVLTLARPATRNALSVELLDDLERQAAAAVHTGARAVVITGSGRTFCSGGDLAGVADVLAHGGAGGLEPLIDQLHRVVLSLRLLPVPVIAALNGSAIGAGLALAMAADVRVAARSASVVTGYAAVSASPDGGASYHLARVLGGPQAGASFLLNRRWGAEQLLARGVVDEVTDDGNLLTRTRELATELSTCSGAVLSAVRELVDRATSHGLEEHLDLEKAHFLAAARTPEFQEAVAAFARPEAARASG